MKESSAEYLAGSLPQGSRQLFANNFCTLFDSNYLPRALVLYRSLRATGEDFTLYAVCLDDLAHDVVVHLGLPGLVVIHRNDFETAELLAVKGQRTAREYCWTCTPHVIRHMLVRHRLPEVTYLDADLCFYSDPSLLLAEFRQTGASVLISPHRFTPRYEQSAVAGIYCVQFLTFKADGRASLVLQWWQDRCLEWCYARLEDGKFGDQKYLDDWPRRFDGVHVLRHIGGGVAPWNVQQYHLAGQVDQYCVDGQPLVFYHFQGYRYYRDGVHDFGPYELSRDVVDRLYRPYAAALLQACADIQAVEPEFQYGWATPDRSWKARAQYGRRLLFGGANRHRIV